MKLRRNAAMSSHEAAFTAFDMQYPAMAKASADQSLPSKAGKVEIKTNGMVCYGILLIIAEKEDLMGFHTKQALSVTVVLVLTGCAAFGIPATSDPNQKLRYAYALMDQCRPIPAERLIGEALGLYKEKGDEIGMAEAYHSFGNLYKFNCYHQKHEKSLLATVGSHEKAYELSKQNFEKAAQLYKKHDDFIGISKSYFGIGNVYGIQGNKSKECAFYDESLKYYYQAQTENLKASANILTNFKDFPEMVEKFKSKDGC